MSVDRAYIAKNDAERGRLRSLVSRLSDADLARAMPAGWTVAGILAHLAFWDQRILALLAQWEQAPSRLPRNNLDEADVDWINDASKPFLIALAPRRAALRLVGGLDLRALLHLLGYLHGLRPVKLGTVREREHPLIDLDGLDRAFLVRRPDEGSGRHDHRECHHHCNQRALHKESPLEKKFNGRKLYPPGLPKVAYVVPASDLAEARARSSEAPSASLWRGRICG